MELEGDMAFPDLEAEIAEIFEEAQFRAAEVAPLSAFSNFIGGRTRVNKSAEAVGFRIMGPNASTPRHGPTKRCYERSYRAARRDLAIRQAITEGRWPANLAPGSKGPPPRRWLSLASEMGVDLRASMAAHPDRGITRAELAKES